LQVTGGPLDCLDLVNATILVDQDDFEGIHIAAYALAEDLKRITDAEARPVIHQVREFPKESSGIIIGSISKSLTLRALVKEGKLDVSTIEKKWECYTTKIVDNPVEGCQRASVIAGSDKRGAIFGLYTLSEQIGVAP
jgi:hypothetical protein